MTTRRVGLIVPSSNVTVESELPQLLGRYDGTTFTFHSSRMRMREVSAAELLSMNVQRERCVTELGDAAPDVLLYACLVALMVVGPGEHRRVESLIREQLSMPGPGVLSSAGVLVTALTALGAKRVALVMPYMKPLAEKVVAYLEAEGFAVADWRALEVADNAEVGCIEGNRVMAAARELDLTGVDALVISCCVQMPSLALVQPAEDEFGIPVLSAATAGAYAVLSHLGLPVHIAGAGSLLSGFPARPSNALISAQS